MNHSHESSHDGDQSNQPLYHFAGENNINQNESNFKLKQAKTGLASLPNQNQESSCSDFHPNPNSNNCPSNYLQLPQPQRQSNSFKSIKQQSSLANIFQRQQILKKLTVDEFRPRQKSQGKPILGDPELIRELCDFGMTEIELLKLQIKRNKRFLGMVIHDFRNPTLSVKYGLEDSHKDLQEALVLLNKEKNGF